jgi:hypothetical protein
MKTCTVFLLVSLVLIVPAPSPAQWTLDGTPVCTVPGNQIFPMIVSDGAGGAIVAWTDDRNGDRDICAQRIDASGSIQWNADGVAICTAFRDQSDPTIVSDGAGGAIVMWTDYRSGATTDIYAQRIDASGAVQWTADGVAICTAANQQEFPTIVSDGAGGAIVTWSDARSDIADIYAQWVDSLGVAQWTANGVALCTAANEQLNPVIVSDGAGGAIVAWTDNRTLTNWYDIYAQWIFPWGGVLWPADGVALCTAVNRQEFPTIVSDGAGGAIVAWQDSRSLEDPSVYAQRVDGEGAVRWTADGVLLGSSVFALGYVSTIASDGAGGAIVAWLRSGGVYEDIFAQRVDASGAVQWTTGGVAICTAAYTQSGPRIVSDGAEGAIVTWYDRRIGGAYDIYAQRVGASGAVQWAADGVAICTDAGNQYNPTMVSDDAGGAIVSWRDDRSGTDSDVYAQRIGPDGGMIPTLVEDTPRAADALLSANYPNPFSDRTFFDLTLRHEVWTRVEVFDATGRRVRTMGLGWLHAGTNHLSFDGRDDHANPLPGGLYFFRVRAGDDTATRRLVIIR